MVLSTISFITITLDKAEASNGAILYVGGSGPGNYTTIQSAIDRASSGDTVFVYSGTYNESIAVEIPINLIGEDKNTTIIHTIGNNVVVANILGDGVHMTGFTIKNNITEYGASRVYVKGNNCVIYNNIIISNCDEYVFPDNSAVKLYFSNNNIITNNTIILNNNYYIAFSLEKKPIGIDIISSFYNTISNNTIIENCIRKDEIYYADGGLGYGIFLYDSEYNLIVSNNITGTDRDIGLSSSCHNNISKNSINDKSRSHCGIEFSYSDNNIIYGNVLSREDPYSYHECGMYFDNSSNNTIQKNMISPYTSGIRFNQCNGNILRENTISNNKFEGLVLTDSHNNYIINNVFQDNGYFRGIELQSSNNNTIMGQVFINSGLYMEKICHNTIINNTVNGKPLIYLEKESHITLEEGDAGQIILISCNNITIRGQHIISNTSFAILLIDTHNSLIEDNIISSNIEKIVPFTGSDIEEYPKEIYGICLHNSNNTVIQSNSISSQYYYGLHLDFSCNNYITNNIFYGCSNGIRLRSCTDNRITHNNFSIPENSMNYRGIDLTHSHNNTLSFNTIKKYIAGIHLSDSHNNSITDNILTNIPEYFGGIFIYCSTDNEIIGNTLKNNGKGINCYNSGGNKIFHNNFINNTKNMVGWGINTWYDVASQKGNYYSDYDEPSEGAYDSNNDGIIDTPYDIPVGNSKDLYPLITPFSTVQSHKGDSNNDGRIDVFDLDAFAQSWGTGSDHQRFRECFDFNDDGKIDVFDLDQFAQSWGKKY